MKNNQAGLEAVRGWCAAIVLLCHGINYSNGLQAGIRLRNQFFGYSLPGHIMVLVFFVLSGFVIGTVYGGARTFHPLDFARKRLIRLYPIYLVALAITGLLSGTEGPVFWSNLFFGQNLFSPPLAGNAPVWSLNHELLYYALAIPILYFRPRLRIIFGVLGATLILSLAWLGFPAIAEGYLVGFIFWLSGFALSRRRRLHEQDLFETQGTQMAGILVLSLAIMYFNPAGDVLKRLPFHHGPSYHRLDNLVNVQDLGILFFCLYCLALVTGPQTRFTRRLGHLLFGVTWAYAGYWFATRGLSKILYIPTALMVLSTLVYYSRLRLPASFFRLLAYLGSISYALYLLHIPMMGWISRIPLPIRGYTGFWLRFGLWIAAVVVLAHLLERRLQPRLKVLLLPRQQVHTLPNSLHKERAGKKPELV